MAEQHALYIDGKWVNTDASVTNINPSDTREVHWGVCSSDARAR